MKKSWLSFYFLIGFILISFFISPIAQAYENDITHESRTIMLGLVQIVIYTLIIAVALYRGLILKKNDISKAVWWLATFIYGSVVVSSLLGIFGYLGIFFSQTVYTMFVYSGLPSPIGLLKFPDSLGDSSAGYLLGYLGGTQTLFLIGVVGILLSIYALSKVEHNIKLSYVFIVLSFIVFAISVANIYLGTCEYRYNSLSSFCSYGAVSAIPGFFSSFVLLTSALLIYYAILQKNKLITQNPTKV